MTNTVKLCKQVNKKLRMSASDEKLSVISEGRAGKNEADCYENSQKREISSPSGAHVQNLNI